HEGAFVSVVIGPTGAFGFAFNSQMGLFGSVAPLGCVWLTVLQPIRIVHYGVLCSGTRFKGKNIMQQDEFIANESSGEAPLEGSIPDATSSTDSSGSDDDSDLSLDLDSHGYGHGHDHGHIPVDDSDEDIHGQGVGMLMVIVVLRVYRHCRSLMIWHVDIMEWRPMRVL
ncbi:hypothetical protein Tco_0944880, partial [Tanacetum coccineum]